MATETNKNRTAEQNAAAASTGALAAGKTGTALPPQVAPNAAKPAAAAPADESGAEIGVEDEVSYVVAEGTVNPELAGASGLFGGLAGAAFGPAGLAAAGLAGLAALGGGGGGGAAGEETPTEAPTLLPTPTPTTTPMPTEQPTTAPGDTEATGVQGTADAAATGVGAAPGIGEPVAGILGTVASGIEENSGTLTSMDPSGTIGPGIEAVLGNSAAPVDGQGNFTNPEDANFGLIGGLTVGGGGAAAEPLIMVRDGLAAQDPGAAPAGGEQLALAQEGALDVLGASSDSPTPASTQDDIPLGDAVSGISSAADALQSGTLPTPPVI